MGTTSACRLSVWMDVFVFIWMKMCVDLVAISQNSFIYWIQDDDDDVEETFQHIIFMAHFVRAGLPIPKYKYFSMAYKCA